MSADRTYPASAARRAKRHHEGCEVLTECQPSAYAAELIAGQVIRRAREAAEAEQRDTSLYDAQREGLLP